MSATVRLASASASMRADAQRGFRDARRQVSRCDAQVSRLVEQIRICIYIYIYIYMIDVHTNTSMNIYTKPVFIDLFIYQYVFAFCILCMLCMHMCIYVICM